MAVTVSQEGRIERKKGREREFQREEGRERKRGLFKGGRKIEFLREGRGRGQG